MSEACEGNWSLEHTVNGLDSISAPHQLPWSIWPHIPPLQVAINLYYLLFHVI